MDKIFERTLFCDGGPNDKGEIIGYYKSESKMKLRYELGCNDGFNQFKEITIEEYNKRKDADLVKFKKLYTI